MAEVAGEACFRCGDPAGYQWQVCADGNTWRPLCVDCDIALNRVVLEWMRHPQAAELVDAYIADLTREEPC